MPATIFTARRPAPNSGGGGYASAGSAGPIGDWRKAVQDALFPFLADAWLVELRGFFRCLATMIRAGLPIHQALGSLQTTARSARMKRVLRDGCHTVAEGGTLSESFSRHPEFFTELQIELLRAGEAGGFLERALDLLTVQVEKELELRRFLSRQTLYPKIILVFALFVIPFVFSLIFGGGPVAAIQDPLLGLVPLAILVAIVFAAGRAVLTRSSEARNIYELAKWRLPGIGPVSRTYALARFGGALSVLYGAGITIATAFRISGRASGSFRIGTVAEQAAQAAERGEPIVPVLRAAGFIPESTLDLLETGMTTGDVDSMMERAAAYLESEADVKAHQAAYVFSMVFFLFVCLFVASRLLPVGSRLAR